MQKYVEMIKHFNKLLSDDKTKEIGRKEKNCFVRESKLGFNELIKYILSRTGKTTSNEINNYYSEIDKLEKSISKQSIFQAREKLNPEVFIYLNEAMIKHYYKNTKIEKEKGFVLLSIDGTQLEMPLNDDTKEKFGISENHKWATQTKTLPRCSGLYDVLNNVYLNFKVNHITMAEIPMAYGQIKLTKNIINEEKCIFLADRNYGATDLFLLFDQLDYKYCFRGKKNFYKHYLDETKTDSIVEITLDEKWIKRFKIEEVKEKALKDRKIKIRVIRFNKSDVINRDLNNDEEIILFTNLSQNEFTKEELMELYGKRWRIETGYGILKTKMEFERVTSEKSNIILQDVYSQIIVYNQISILKI